MLDWTILFNKLLGQTNDSEAIENFLLHLKNSYREKVKTQDLQIETKTFSGALYYNIRAFGLSLCFDRVEEKSDAKDKELCGIHKLAAIHIFQYQQGYATCPFKFPGIIDLSWKARDVVLNFGEPQKKTGGGSSPVSITYTTREPKMEIDFVSGNWNDPFNLIASRTCSMVDVATAFNIPPLDTIVDVISNKESNIVEKVKHIFYARHHGGPKAVDALQIACKDPSVLLAHEAAYLIGQLGEPCALPFLLNLLCDETNHCMVRHEAAESLAAIGELDAVPILEKYSYDSCVPVRETCELALRSLREKGETDCVIVSQFNTVDPIAQPSVRTKEPLEVLRAMLLDETQELYKRYKALFELRDIQTKEANDCIIDALQDRSSALFRHEVAFVLGQIRTPECVKALLRSVRDKEEHSMSRHEAALALGSVGCLDENVLGKAMRQEILDTLLEISKDEDPIVAESCLVALDNIHQESTMVS